MSAVSDPGNVKASESDSKRHCMICLDSKPAALVHGPCNHTVICGPCYLLNKIKYEKNSCVLCGETLQDPMVIHPEDLKDSYSDYALASTAYSRRVGCYFQERPLLREYESKLNITCPSCRVAFQSISQLKAHAAEHNKEFCNICLTKRKVFYVNQRLYTSKEINKHRNNGDPPEGIDGPIPAHIKCNLCRDWSYDRDDYVNHMIMNHQCCQLCKRRGTEVWLASQDELTNHYGTDHLVCDFPECVAKPLENVYEDEIALQSHFLSIHGREVSKQERKAAARLNFDFSYSRPSSSSVSTTTRAAHMVSSSMRTSASASSLRTMESNALVEQSASSEKASSGPIGPIDIMRELQSLLGVDGFVVFKGKCIEYFKGEMSADDFYEYFRSLFLQYTIAPLLWIQLVDSLPEFNLRDKLHRAHHDAVKNQRGLNKSQTQADGKKVATVAVPSTVAATPTAPPTTSVATASLTGSVWSAKSESETSNTATAKPVASQARPKAKGPMKGKSVWTTPLAQPGKAPPVVAGRVSTASVVGATSSAGQPASTVQSGNVTDWSREILSMAEFPAMAKKKPAKAVAVTKKVTISNAWERPIAASAVPIPCPTNSMAVPQPSSSDVDAVGRDDGASDKKKGKKKVVLMQIGLRI